MKKSANNNKYPYWFSSVPQSCLTLWGLMDYSTPGFLVHHHLPELAETHVHQVSDAIQPTHPVIPFSSCLQSIPASGSFLMIQFFSSGGQSIRASSLASVLSMNIQDWFPVGLTGLISLHTCIPSYYQNTIISSFLIVIPFTFFSFVPALARSSKMMFCRWDVIRYPC